MKKKKNKQLPDTSRDVMTGKFKSYEKWEEDFAERFPLDVNYWENRMVELLVLWLELKSFIRTLLKKQRKELLGKVENMVKDEIYLGMGKPNADNLYERLQELKQKLEE